MERRTLSAPAPTHAEVRQQLDEVLRTDADLEAFCLDHFPDVHRRFSGRMERTDKVNLLLSLVERDDLVAKLREHTGPRGSRRRRAGWGGAAIALALLALALASVGLYWASHREPERPAAARTETPPAARPPGEHTMAAPVPTGINSGNVILDSAGAVLRNRAPSAALRDAGTAVNSGNRIEGSPGAVISNEVGGP